MTNGLKHRRSLFLFSGHGTYSSANFSWDFSFEDPITHDKDVRDYEYRQPRIGLLNAHLPMSFYVVSSTTNVLTITRDGTPYDLTLTPGNYTPASLVTRLNQLTGAALGGGTTFAWDFSSVTMKMEAYVDRTVDALTYSFGGGNTTVGAWFGLDDNGAVSWSDPVFTAVAPYVLDLAGPRYIFVDVDLPVESSDSSRRVRGILGAIPVGSPPGTMQYWQPSQVQYHLTSFDSLRSLNVRLTDQNHVPLDFNNVEWAMEMEFT